MEFCHNTSYQQSINMTPFSALYGHECLSPLNILDPISRVEASKKILEDIEQKTKAIQKDIQAT